jgi:hypothetical protein
MTMQAEEEKLHPLPEEYFALLLSRMETGVQVTRIGFGGEKEFEPLELQTRMDSPHYRFILAPSAAIYRRMLLVDGSRLLFAKTDKTGRKVYYTEEPETITAYTEYFNGLLKN